MKTRRLSLILIVIIILFPTLYNSLLRDLAELIVAIIFPDPSLAQPRVVLVTDKLSTTVRLSGIAGIAFLYSEAIVRGTKQIFRINPKVAISFLYLAVPGLAFTTSGIIAFDINNRSIIFTTIFFSLIFELLVSIILIYLLSIFTRRLLMPVLIIFAYDVLVLSLASLVYLSGEMSYKYYIGLIKSSDFSFLFDWRIAAALVLHFMLLFISVRVARDYLKGSNGILRNRALRNSCVAFALIAVALYFQPLLIFSKVLALPRSFVASHALEVDGKNASLLLAGHIPRALMDLTVVYRQASRTSDKIPGDLIPITRELDLFRNPPPPDLTRKHFERIMLVGIESLSLEFTGFRKPPCSTSITPNLDRLMHEYPSGALLTNATPSLESLTSIFVSHPNAREARSQGFPNSFVRRLQSHGFHTVAAQPASEKFDNMQIDYRRAGFDIFVGSQFFNAKSEYSSYISGWGLEDAKLYQYATEVLEANSNQKLFFLLTTADTHGPFGREAYSTLYPELPSNISCRISNERLLRAVFRADYDLGRFIDEIKGRGLLDEKTLLIVTADHSSPPFYEPPPPSLAHVPVIFVSKTQNLRLVSLTDYSSLYDLGPTILALAGLDAARGYFGRDLFASQSSNYFGEHGKRLYWQNEAGKGTIDIDLPRDQRERDLINLNNFFLFSD